MAWILLNSKDLMEVCYLKEGHSVISPQVQVGTKDRQQKIQKIAICLHENSEKYCDKWIHLCLSYIDFIAPKELEMETGRLIKILSQYPMGLSRDDLLDIFYPNFHKSSDQRQQSYRVCLEKMIQRSRINFKKYDLSILYDKQKKLYFVVAS